MSQPDNADQTTSNEMPSNDHLLQAFAETIGQIRISHIGSEGGKHSPAKKTIH